jgi:hypothetical protein
MGDEMERTLQLLVRMLWLPAVRMADENLI